MKNSPHYRLNMHWHDAFLRVLKQNLQRKKKINSSYSVRKFASTLGLSIGTLSELLTSKRKLTQKRALKVLDKLDLSVRERRLVLSLMDADVEFERIGVDPINYDIYTDWRCQAIAGMFELEDADLSVNGISRRLGLPPAFVQERIDEFVRRGLLVKKKDGSLVRPLEDWDPRSLPKEVMRQAQAEQLKTARMALDHLPSDQRELQAITFTGRKDQLERFRREITKVLNRFSALSEENPKDQLYRVCIQLFSFDFGKNEK